MSTARYVLEGRTPIECPDTAAWQEWLRSADRHVAVTCISSQGVLITISSEFVGVDSSGSSIRRPRLFLTRVFGGPLAGRTWHGPTSKAAIRHHAAAMAGVITTLL